MLLPRRGGTRSASALLDASYRESIDKAPITGGDVGSASRDLGDLVSIDAAALLRTISCPLCRGVFRDACTINECIHSFCRECIEAFCGSSINGPASPVSTSGISSSYAFAMRRRVCPQCSGQITVPPYTADPVLQSLASKLSQQCAESAEGRRLLEEAEAARERHRSDAISDTALVSSFADFNASNMDAHIAPSAQSLRSRSIASPMAAVRLGSAAMRMRKRARDGDERSDRSRSGTGSDEAEDADADDDDDDVSDDDHDDESSFSGSSGGDSLSAYGDTDEDELDGGGGDGISSSEEHEQEGMGSGGSSYSSSNDKDKRNSKSRARGNRLRRAVESRRKTSSTRRRRRMR